MGEQEHLSAEPELGIGRGLVEVAQCGQLVWDNGGRVRGLAIGHLVEGGHAI
jgi:hypothetical protein